MPLVDLKGTYNKPIGPPIRRQSKPTPGSRVLSAVVEGKNGNYFLKFSGPESTVSDAEAAFRTAFGAKQSEEKKVGLEDL